MSNDHTNEKAENAHLAGAVRVDVPQDKDVTEARNAGAQKINQVEVTRTNRHNGSAGGEQELSFEIDFGDGRKASRANALTEASANQKTEANHTREQDNQGTNIQLKIGGQTYDPLSVIAKAPTDKTQATDATNAKAHKTEVPSHKLEKHLGKAHEVQQKPPAPEGKDISLGDFFHKYSSPFADAYHHSKALKPGEKGKSPTLETIVDRVLSVPWANQLKVKIDHWSDNSHYDNEHNRLTIKPYEDKGKLVQEAGHESFHASHQFLGTLYNGNKPLEKESFVRTFVSGEADSVIAEIKLKKELSSDKPITFFMKPWFGPPKHIDLESLFAKHGREGLIRFLGTAQPADPKQTSYNEHYGQSYDDYVKNFKNSKAKAVELQSVWKSTGRREEDL